MYFAVTYMYLPVSLLLQNKIVFKTRKKKNHKNVLHTFKLLSHRAEVNRAKVKFIIVKI